MDVKESQLHTYLKKDISDLLPSSPSYYHRKLTKREKIKRLRRSLEAGNIMGPALRDAFMSPTVICDWKKKCNFDRLSKLVYAAKDRGQITRNEIVEDAHFRRLATGMASGSEYEFYMTNRMTERWKKLNEFGSTQGAPVLLKPPIINYVSVSVSSKEPIDVTVENNTGRVGGHV